MAMQQTPMPKTEPIPPTPRQPKRKEVRGGKEGLEAARMLEDHPGQGGLPKQTSEDQAEALSTPRKKRAKRVGYGD